MKFDPKIYIVDLPKGAKYKKLCKKLFKNYLRFCFYDNSKLSINVPKLMNILINKLKPIKDLNYARNVKYTQMDIINGIFEVLHNSTYWIRYQGIVPGNYLRIKHKEYEKLGVYSCMYKIVLDIYFRKCKYEKLKDQSIDSTFIRNLYGVEMIRRNKYYNNKNGIKVSTIDDKNGVATSIAISRGSTNDAIIGIKQANYSFINYNPKRVKYNNRFKPNILGDSHYYHKKFKRIMKRKGYNVYTDVNIRNTRNEKLLKEMEKDKKKYKNVTHKRSIKEISFGWIHKYPKLDRYVEKSVKSYAGLLLLGYSLIISKKLT